MTTFPTVPFVNAPSTATPLSAAGINSRFAEVGDYAAAKEYQSLNVKDLGVVGGGVTDDTAAINAAIVTASALTGLTRLYFPDDTYLTDGVLVKSDVWLDLGSSTLKKLANGTGAPTNSVIRAIPVEDAGTYYGTYENIKITGGFIDLNGKTCPAHIVNLDFIEHLEVDGLTVTHQPTNLTWAIALGGRYGTVRNCRVLGGTAVFQDGIHLAHGMYWRIENNYIECGDDALPLGGEPSDPISASDPESIRYVSITNNVVKAEKGYAFKAYVQAGGTGTDWEISDVAVTGLTGTSGTTRNGGLAVIDSNSGAAGTSQIKRVTVSNVALNVGSATHDDTNPYGIWVASASHVTFRDVDMRITEKTVGGNFDLAIVTESEDVKFDGLSCDSLCERYGVDVADSNRVSILNCKLRYNTAGNNAHIRLVNAVDTKIHGNYLLDALDAWWCILVTTGTTSSGSISNNKMTQEAGSTTGGGVGVVSTAFTHLSITDNDFNGCSNGANTGSFGSTATYIIKGNRNLDDFSRTNTVPTVASAAALTPSLASDVMFVSGTTNITSMTVQAGRQITLIFTGTAGGTGLTAGSNLKIPANFVWTPSDTYRLACDGTNWYAAPGGVVNPT